MSSLEESDQGPICETALVMPERQDDLDGCYKCCALNLADLHALVEHFEEYHDVVLDPYFPRPLLPTSSSLRLTVSSQMASRYPEYNTVPSAPFPQAPELVQGEQTQPLSCQTVDTDGMDLYVDPNLYWSPSSVAPSPSVPLSNLLFPIAPSASASPSASPIGAFETTRDLSSRFNSNPHLHHPQPRLAPKLFDPDGMDLHVDPTMGRTPSSITPPPSGLPLSLSGHTSSLAVSSATCSASKNPSTTPVSVSGTTQVQPSLSSRDGRETCDTTTLLLTRSSANTPDSFLLSSRVASPLLGRYGGPRYRENAQTPWLRPGSSAGLCLSSINPATLQSGTQPQEWKCQEESAWSLMQKKFRCPKPGCHKSYKHRNGLKYHTTFGSCTAGPSKDFQKLQELLASKRSSKAAATGEVELSKMDLMEVHQEVDKTVRPFACEIGGCQRRYKSAGGLRYHCKYSRDHEETSLRGTYTSSVPQWLASEPLVGRVTPGPP